MGEAVFVGGGTLSLPMGGVLWTLSPPAGGLEGSTGGKVLLGVPVSPLVWESSEAVAVEVKRGIGSKW